MLRKTKTTNNQTPEGCCNYADCLDLICSHNKKPPKEECATCGGERPNGCICEAKGKLPRWIKKETPLDELIRDLCSVEFRSKSKTRELLMSYQEAEKKRIADIIQEKLDKNDNPSLKAGLLYALTVLEAFPELDNNL